MRFEKERNRGQTPYAPAASLELIAPDRAMALIFARGGKHNAETNSTT
jgi:hypothetical protein